MSLDSGRGHNPFAHLIDDAEEHLLNMRAGWRDLPRVLVGRAKHELNMFKYTADIIGAYKKDHVTRQTYALHAAISACFLVFTSTNLNERTRQAPELARYHGQLQMNLVAGLAQRAADAGLLDYSWTAYYPVVACHAPVGSFAASTCPICRRDDGQETLAEQLQKKLTDDPATANALFAVSPTARRAMLIWGYLPGVETPRATL